MNEYERKRVFELASEHVKQWPEWKQRNMRNAAEKGVDDYDPKQKPMLG